MNLDQIVEHYVALRNQKADIEARHKEELEPVKRDMALIEAALLKHLQGMGAKNIKTPHGTAYISEVTAAKVQDWGETLPWIIENEAWHLLVQNVSKTALLESGADVPGVTTTTTLKLNVRKS